MSKAHTRSGFLEHCDPSRKASVAVLTGVALLALVASCGLTSATADTHAAAQAGGTRPAKPAATTSRYRPDRLAGKAGRYYRLVWGVDALSMRLAESDALVRFAWRVVDPDKARMLNDKALEPALIDPQAGVSLSVPSMEKIGQLRQSTPAEAGKSYWMVFSNKGRLVKRGDRVQVVIGEFRADGLAVD